MDITQLKAQYKAGERNFSGAQLSGVSLVWVELTGINFVGADLSHANLSGANLSESNLSGATNLTFADLSRADLRNTNLKGTRLEGANLEGIQLEGAVYDEATKFPIGFDPIKVGAIASQPLRPVVTAVAEQLQPAADLEQYATRERPQLREKETKSKTPPPRILGPKPTVDKVQELVQKVRSVAVETVSDWQTAKQPNWVSAQSTQTISPTEPFAPLNTSGQGKSGIVPPTIKGSWNWGALLLPCFWCFPNRVWGGLWLWLLVFIPGWWSGWIWWGFAIALAANGNTWAWQSRKWNSVEAFQKHQRGWAIAGIVVRGLIFFLLRK
jgi:hypothetical protein